MAIRVAVTGRTATPPLFDTLVALGRQRALDRLGRAIGALESQPAADPSVPAMVRRLPRSNALTKLGHPRAMARTVLIVEDETILRETLAEALESEGYRVVTAASTVATRSSSSARSTPTSCCST